MKFRVYVSFKNGILDPEAEAIKKTITGLGFNNIKTLSRGKFFDIEMNSSNVSNKEIIKNISNEILSNPIIENFQIKKID